MYIRCICDIGHIFTYDKLYIIIVWTQNQTSLTIIHIHILSYICMLLHHFAYIISINTPTSFSKSDNLWITQGRSRLTTGLCKKNDAFNPCRVENTFEFSIMYLHWNGRGTLKSFSFSVENRNKISSKLNVMAADVLAMRIARAQNQWYRPSFPRMFNEGFKISSHTFIQRDPRRMLLVWIPQ